MDESTDSDLTRESLIHDLNNVFETITEVADLLSSDRQWKPLAATLTRCVARGKRLTGAIPDSTPNLAAVIARRDSKRGRLCRRSSQTPYDVRLRFTGLRNSPARGR